MEEGRKSADHADHDSHGMGVRIEAFEEVLQFLVHEHLVLDTLLENGEVFFGRKLLIEQQETDFDKGAFRG